MLTKQCSEVLSRILSIQSHVVRGYVGNKSAVFTLQLLGHHVDFINTVQYTNMFIHEGSVTDIDTLKILLRTLPLCNDSSLMSNFSRGKHYNEYSDSSKYSFIDHKFVLTGYIPNKGILDEVVSFINFQKTNTKHLIYWICDPVLGDNGKHYVSLEVANSYCNSVLKHVDVLTPNQFELEFLTKKKIKSIDDAVKCCEILHECGPLLVVVTSLETTDSNTLKLLASKKHDTYFELILIEFPKIPVYIGGTGDVMAALLVDGFDRFNWDISRTCERAVAILQGMIRHTIENKSEPNYDIDVVGAAHEILNPSYSVTSKHFTNTKSGC